MNKSCLQNTSALTPIYLAWELEGLHFEGTKSMHELTTQSLYLTSGEMKQTDKEINQQLTHLPPLTSSGGGGCGVALHGELVVAGEADAQGLGRLLGQQPPLVGARPTHHVPTPPAMVLSMDGRDT
jgi:hypothetical protein